MTNRLPPVPPANRSKFAPNAEVKDDKVEANVTEHDARKRNLKEQGRQGNIAQNTTNQGLQQDR